MAVDGINQKQMQHRSGLRRERKDDRDGFRARYKTRTREIEDEIEEKRSLPDESSNEVIESEQSEELNSQSKRILLEWRAPEFMYFEKGKMWYFVMALAFAGLVAFGIWTKSFITVITFVILFVIIYIYAQRKPEEIYFAVTLDGIIYGNSFFPYESIEGFWLDYDPPHNAALHIHVRRMIAPKLTIQLTDQDPVELRRMLIKEVPENERLADGLTENLSRRIKF